MKTISIDKHSTRPKDFWMLLSAVLITSFFGTDWGLFAVPVIGIIASFKFRTKEAQ